MKKAWRTTASYGRTLVALYQEDGTILDYYKEYDKATNTMRAREFSFQEYLHKIPMRIAEDLNEGLKAANEYAEFIIEK